MVYSCSTLNCLLSGDSEEHLFDEDSPDRRVDERSDEMELGPGPVAMANASRSGGDNSDNSEFNRTGTLGCVCSVSCRHFLLDIIPCQRCFLLVECSLWDRF